MFVLSVFCFPGCKFSHRKACAAAREIRRMKSRLLCSLSHTCFIYIFLMKGSLCCANCRRNGKTTVRISCLCICVTPVPGMPALLQGLKSYLLRASHQSPERCLQQFQIRIGLTPHQVRATCVTVSRLSRGVVFPGASLRVHLSAGSPFHCYHPEPKKLSQL